jgi:hypothetical protein
MQSKVIIEDTAESTRALERARKRIKFALSMTDSGLLDFETMDAICRSLSLALRDLDTINSAYTSEQLAA